MPGEHQQEVSPPAPDGGSAPQRLLVRVDGLQRRHAVLAFPVGVVRKFGDDRAGQLAALVAYYAFFSLFPLLLAVTTIVAYVAGNKTAQELQDSALAQIPVIGTQIAGQVNTLSGSGIALVIGVLLALWAGLGCILAAQDAMSDVWNVPRARQAKFVAKVVRSLGVLAVVGFALVLGSTATQAVSWLPESAGVARAAGILGSCLINVGLILVAFQVLNPQRHPWRELLPGAVVAGVGYTLLQLVGRWYVDRTIKGATDTYGTFAVVIGLLSWLYLVGQLLLVAAEINVVTARRLWPRSLLPEAITDADHRALAGEATEEQLVADEQIDVEFPRT